MAVGVLALPLASAVWIGVLVVAVVTLVRMCLGRAALAWAVESTRRAQPDRWWATLMAALTVVPFVNVHRLHPLLGVPATLSGISNGFTLVIFVFILSDTLLSRQVRSNARIVVQIAR